MQEIIDIGIGRTARRAYELDDIDIVAQRRTRSSQEISTTWQIDAYKFDLPFITHPSDTIGSPEFLNKFSDLGGLAVFNAEGIWARHKDAAEKIAQVVQLATHDITQARKLLRSFQLTPIQPDLIAEAVAEIRNNGSVVAVRVSPQRAYDLTPHLLQAGIDILVVQGTIISAEHVDSGEKPPVNLKTFISDIDIPVIAGGVSDHRTALHLMRTGAVGVIVGYGAYEGVTHTNEVLGIYVPMATAIADAAGARRDYMDETEGRYVHIIADGGMHTSGDVAKAIALGADAVMLGAPLAHSSDAPGKGCFWTSVLAHPSLPRADISTSLYNGRGQVIDRQLPSLSEVIVGPACDSYGTSNFGGALRRSMAKTGYTTVKEFQRVPLNVRR